MMKFVVREVKMVMMEVNMALVEVDMAMMEVTMAMMEVKMVMMEVTESNNSYLKVAQLVKTLECSIAKSTSTPCYKC